MTPGPSPIIGELERVKRELAARDWGSRDEYARAKSTIIAEIRAER
jgi:GrpB-like predicted nucleotidyltransferase (UPF0157 family)